MNTKSATCLPTLYALHGRNLRHMKKKLLFYNLDHIYHMNLNVKIDSKWATAAHVIHLSFITGLA